MKSPESVEAVTRRPAARGLQPKPPGGKALARLLEFSALRGLPTPAIPATAQEAAGAPAAARAPAKRSRGREAAAPPESDGGAAIAQTYAQVAVGLQSQAAPPAPRARGPGPRDMAPAAADVAAAAAAPVAWRPLGPTMMPNGQTYGSGRTLVAGRVSCVAVDPGNGNHVLCGSAAGGIWESFDSGTTWAPRSDFAPTLTVGAIAFAPSAPSTVYCGTGEGNFYAGLGAGVLRSTNGGTTWAPIAGAPFMGQGFYDLAVDPADANHLLAACTVRPQADGLQRNGLHESSDGGLTWTPRRSARTWSIAYQPSGGAGAEVLAACEDGLFRSTDGGTTWSAVALPGAPAGWSRLAVSMVRADSRVAYAFGSAGGRGWLYRRDAGGTWAALAVPTDLDVKQDWYDWCLQAAPDRDSQVYIGAIDNYRGDFSGGTWTWTKLSAKSSGDSIHPDQHAFALHPTDPDVLYAGSDGGLYRSPNRGVSWVACNNGLAITEIEYLSQHCGNVRFLLAGTQDNGSVRYQGAPVWEHVQDGDGGDCGINQADPTVCYHTYFSMGMERSTQEGAWDTWSWIGPDVPDDYQALFYPPVEVCNDTVAMAGKSVFVSRNRGTDWTEVELPADADVATAMHAPTPERLYVGTRQGRVCRLDFDGTSWTRTDLATPRDGASISDLHIEPGNPNGLWATSTRPRGGRIFASGDGGTSWTDRSAGLPELPLNAVCLDPAHASRVWVAADLGVYESLDGGATWSVFGTGLPNVLVADLVFHAQGRVLRAGTRNRGAWELPVDGWMTEPVCGVQFSGTVAAQQSASWFTFNWPATWHVLWTVMPTTPTPGAPSLSWKVQVERATPAYVTYWISVTNLGTVPVQFEGRYAILSKY